MEPRAVVKAPDVVEERCEGLIAGGKPAVPDGLGFEAAPEGSNVGVVVAVALAAHGSDQAVVGEDVAEGRAGNDSQRCCLRRSESQRQLPLGT